MTGKNLGIHEGMSAPYPSSTPAIPTPFSLGRALYSTPCVIVFSHPHPATLAISQKFPDRIRNKCLVCRAWCYHRSLEPAVPDNCTGRCHRSIFHEHNPPRNHPRTTKRPQMPNVVCRDDANCPDHDRHRRCRPHQRQQPEHIPWIYDRCA